MFSFISVNSKVDVLSVRPINGIMLVRGDKRRKYSISTGLIPKILFECYDNLGSEKVERTYCHGLRIELGQLVFHHFHLTYLSYLLRS